MAPGPVMSAGQNPKHQIRNKPKPNKYQIGKIQNAILILSCLEFSEFSSF
jgi:hypothetical protein